MGAVSSVGEIRNRLLMEHLEELADRLRSGEPIALEEFKEQLVRLLTGAVLLLRQHRVNKKGRCNYCQWTGWTWRFWRRRPQCTVYRGLDFVMRQPLALVWGQLLEDHKARPKPK